MIPETRHAGQQNSFLSLDFESNAVRTVMIDGKPWWVAVDVCRALGIQNSRQALQPLFDDQKGVYNLYTLGGEQAMNIVSLGGLFMILSRSSKPIGRRMMRWVTEEVLPALLRDGVYEMPGQGSSSLKAKRDYCHALPDAHKERAAVKTAVLARIAALVDDGARVSHAIAEVAEETGLSKRTLYGLRRATYMVADTDHAAAVAPRWLGRQGQLAECHPEAMQFYAARVLAGARYSHAYQALLDAAQLHGWTPIPCSRTMARAVARMLPQRPKASGTIAKVRAA